MLGLHGGLSFENSRAAIANSLGTMFFLFLGIFICMMLILEARSSFWLQLPSFLVFILGGAIGLSASLTHKNPSPALTLSAFILPFFTFYSITDPTTGNAWSLAGSDANLRFYDPRDADSGCQRVRRRLGPYHRRPCMTIRYARIDANQKSVPIFIWQTPSSDLLEQCSLRSLL